jgi:hypothetical protein
MFHTSDYGVRWIQILVLRKVNQHQYLCEWDGSTRRPMHRDNYVIGGANHTWDGVLLGAAKGPSATVLSPRQCHAAFGTMPHTLSSVDQSPVCRPRTLCPPQPGRLRLDFQGTQCKYFYILYINMLDSQAFRRLCTVQCIANQILFTGQ